MNERLRMGGTLSGHEPNCAFLNLGQGPMATISSICGFDFADDGRGLAVADFDDDGDLDVWITNRTGPRLRYLRNDTPSSRFIQFRLQGVHCNRDAIGALVELILKDDNDRFVKTLRAGEGFLSQSSKTIHFGIPKGKEIERVLVRWPGGKTEAFDGLKANHTYQLVEGSGQATLAGTVDRSHTARPSPHPEIVPDVHSVLTSPIPMPRIHFQTLEPTPRLQALHFGQSPVLVNLWATWCNPCVQELALFARNADQLRAVDLRVVALCADEPSQKQPSRDPAEIIKSIQFPFVAGSATEETVLGFQQLYQLPFAAEQSMPVPTSFLISAKGELVAIYRGPVDLERLLADVQRFGRDSLLPISPFAGRWNQEPNPTEIMPIARQLTDRGQLDDAVEYVQKNDKRLNHREDFSELLTSLAESLVAKRRFNEAVQIYRRAIEVDPKDVSAINNFAWLLATCDDPAVRKIDQAVRLARQATKLTEAKNVSVLDTLATSLRAAGRSEDAVRVWERAIELAIEAGDTDRAAQLKQRIP